MNHIRYGNGAPLLLIHGIGGNWKSWMPVLDGLTAHREVIAIDLPGSGKTPPLTGETTIATLADALMSFINAHGLQGIDAVGSSMGARLVLEMVRRGDDLGSVVSLNPGGFWQGWQTNFFYSSVALSIRLVRLLNRVGLLPLLSGNFLTRSILFAQFSAHPWKLSSRNVYEELRAYATSPVFDQLLHNLTYGEKQKGSPEGTIKKPLVIGWGKGDRVCFPSQAKNALEHFPDAQLHWFHRCGHFPHWDQPEQTIQLILKTTGKPTEVLHQAAQDSKIV